MKQQIKLMGCLLITCLIVVLLAACGDSSIGSAVAQTINLTIADSGKNVTAHQNDLIAVSLEGNPTTGYVWSVASGTGTVLTQEGEPKYTPTSTDPMTAGAGGTYICTFKAAQQGIATLKLIYAQPWNSILPAQTFEVTVVVRN